MALMKDISELKDFDGTIENCDGVIIYPVTIKDNHIYNYMLAINKDQILKYKEKLQQISYISNSRHRSAIFNIWEYMNLKINQNPDRDVVVFQYHIHNGEVSSIMIYPSSVNIHDKRSIFCAYSRIDIDDDISNSNLNIEYLKFPSWDQLSEFFSRIAIVDAEIKPDTFVAVSQHRNNVTDLYIDFRVLSKYRSELEELCSFKNNRVSLWNEITEMHYGNEIQTIDFKIEPDSRSIDCFSIDMDDILKEALDEREIPTKIYKGGMRWSDILEHFERYRHLELIKKPIAEIIEYDEKPKTIIYNSMFVKSSHKKVCWLKKLFIHIFHIK